MSNIINIRDKINKYYKDKKEQYLKEKSKKRNNKWLKYYGSKEWHQLRDQYYYLHPICEVCSKLNIIKPATEVHHLHIFDRALTEQGKWNLLLNEDNLCSLCSQHHNGIHKYLKENNKDYCSIDEYINSISN